MKSWTVYREMWGTSSLLKVLSWKETIRGPRHRWEDNTYTYIEESNVREKGLNLT